MADKKLDLEELARSFLGSSGDFGQALQYLGASNASELNSGLYDIEAKGVLSDSEYTAKRIKERGDSFVGNQIAMYAKAGVTFDGSPIKVIQQTEKNIRMDIMTTRYNAVKEANLLGYKSLQEKLSAGRARTRAVQSFGKGIVNMVGSYALNKEE